VKIKNNIENGETDFAALEAHAMERLSRCGFKPEYVSLRNADDLGPANPDARAIVVLAAAWLGGARLIDNITVR
jgi:pantoate--beta-alanine ligase